MRGSKTYSALKSLVQRSRDEDSALARQGEGDKGNNYLRTEFISASNVIQTSRNYKSRTVAQTLEPWLAVGLWLVAAALAGWALALVVGIFADRNTRALTPWSPAPIARTLQPQQAVKPNTTVTFNNAPWQFVGILDDRVYVRSGNKPQSFAEGETLPNGDVLRKIEKDAIVISSAGKESRVALYKLVGDAAKAASAATASATGANVSPPSGAAACRLSAADRAAATWIEPAVATALAAESKTFARIFVPLVGAGEGVRAQATGGTTAMFGIQDGDTLLRADGKGITSGLSVVSDVIGRVQRGESVVVEGERAGAARRWVFAPSSCR